MNNPFVQKEICKQRFKNERNNKGFEQGGKQKSNYYKQKFYCIAGYPLKSYTFAGIQPSIPEILNSGLQGYNPHYYNARYIDKTLGKNAANNKKKTVKSIIVYKERDGKSQ